MKVIDKFEGIYEWLSNFSIHGFVDEDGLVWKTNEHYYQAMKTTDMEWREKIRNAKTPYSAKKLGNKAPLRSDWESVKITIMKKGLKMKFDYHTDLKQDLLDTGDIELIEGNWWGDIFWGQSSVTKNFKKHDRVIKKGEGANWLGVLLMELRREYNRR